VLRGTVKIILGDSRHDAHVHHLVVKFFIDSIQFFVIYRSGMALAADLNEQVLFFLVNGKHNCAT